jgi:prepilin-type N-terminal cleavage/methylation domain-containing protein
MKRAFTLIEVLIVIFILSILAALGTSVAGYVVRLSARHETTTTQRLLIQAVQSFYDASIPKTYPPDCYDPSIPRPNDSCRVLLNHLTGKYDPDNSGSLAIDKSQTPAARSATTLLLQLPRDAWDGYWNSSVKDAWKHTLRYEARGGLGSVPVLISAGPDGLFGVKSTDREGEDDIRSDESQ